MEDQWISESEWRERFRPINNPFTDSEYFESGYEDQTAFLEAQNPATVWSEMINWDEGTTNLISGYGPFGAANGWYVAEIPVTDIGNDGNVITVFVELDEWADDDDEDDDDDD